VYSSKLSFIIKRKLKTFHNKLREFMTSKPALQKILKGILYTEEGDKHNHENMGMNKSR
jgi:nucleoside diphosphate kinase